MNKKIYTIILAISLAQNSLTMHNDFYSSILANIGNDKSDESQLREIIQNLKKSNNPIDDGEWVKVFFDAISYDLSNILEELLEYGVNANSVYCKKSALCFATSRASWKCVDVLLEYKANPNLVDKNGKTPLILLVSDPSNSFDELKAKNLKYINSLLEAGADPKLQKNGHLNAIEAARVCGFEDIAVLLEKEY